MSSREELRLEIMREIAKLAVNDQVFVLLEVNEEKGSYVNLMLSNRFDKAAERLMDIPQSQRPGFAYYIQFESNDEPVENFMIGIFNGKLALLRVNFDPWSRRVIDAYEWHYNDAFDDKDFYRDITEEQADLLDPDAFPGIPFGAHEGSVFHRLHLACIEMNKLKIDSA